MATRETSPPTVSRPAASSIGSSDRSMGAVLGQFWSVAPVGAVGGLRAP
ncbi:hypothetical protein [Micromonospora sp. NPDC000442]